MKGPFEHKLNRLNVINAMVENPGVTIFFIIMLTISLTTVVLSLGLFR